MIDPGRLLTLRVVCHGDYSERLLWCGWVWPQGTVTIVLSKAGNVADSDISTGLHNDKSVPCVDSSKGWLGRLSVGPSRRRFEFKLTGAPNVLS